MDPVRKPAARTRGYAAEVPEDESHEAARKRVNQLFVSSSPNGVTGEEFAANLVEVMKLLYPGPSGVHALFNSPGLRSLDASRARLHAYRGAEVAQRFGLGSRGISRLGSYRRRTNSANRERILKESREVLENEMQSSRFAAYDYKQIKNVERRGSLAKLMGVALGIGVAVALGLAPRLRLKELQRQLRKVR